MNQYLASAKSKGNSILFLLVLTVVTAASAAIGAKIEDPRIKNYILKNVTQEIEKNSGLDAKVGNFEIRLPRSIVVSDLVFTERKTNTKILSAKKLTASMSLLDMVKGKVGISGLTCEKPELYVVRRRDGSTNFDDMLGRDKSEGRKMTVRLNNATLNVEDQLKRKKPLKAKIQLRKAMFKVNPRGPATFKLEGVRLGKSVFDAGGRLGFERGDTVKVSASSKNFDLGDVKKLFEDYAGKTIPGADRADVVVAFKISVGGRVGSETARVDVQSGKGTVAGKTIEKLSARCMITRNGADVSKLTVKMGGGTIFGRAKYSAKGGEKGLNADIGAEGFPMEVLSAFSGTKTPVSGTLYAKAKLNASDPKKLATWNGAVNFRAADGKIDGLLEGESLPFNVMEGDAAIEQGRTSVNRFFLTGDELDLELAGAIGADGSLDLNGRAEISKEMAREKGVKKIIGEFLPDGEKGYKFKLRIGGRLGEPEMKLSAANTMYRGIEDKFKDSGNKMEKFFKKVF